MNNNWKKVALSDVAMLYDSLHQTPQYSENGYSMVRVTDIKRGYLDLAETKKVDEKIYKEFTKKYKPQVGDIVFSRVGSYGNSSYVNKIKAFCLGQNTVCISPNQRLLNSFYLYSCLNSPFVKQQIDACVGGSSQPTISLKNINTLQIPYPSLPVQNKIAAILSNYDRLIENNTRRIEILEEMARSLYDEWFVKFRFPGYEQTKMVDSELGLIPERWEVKKVTDTVFINPKTQVPKEGEKPFVPMGCLTNNLMLISNTESRCGNSGSKFKNGDTLFARITPCLENGKTGYVQFLPTENTVAFGSTEFIVLRSKSLCPEYVYLMARSDKFRDNAIKSMSGATGRQRVQEACFNKFLIPHPHTETISMFSNVVSPIFRNIYVLSQKNQNLITTRDLLLPKLISGEIDVENLDIETEVAA